MKKFVFALVLGVLTSVSAFAQPQVPAFSTGTQQVVLAQPVLLIDNSPEVVAQFAGPWYALDLWSSVGAPFETVAVGLQVEQVGKRCTSAFYVRQPGQDGPGTLVASGPGLFTVAATGVRHAQVENRWTAGERPCTLRVRLTGALLP
jgi:hypothetical protein